MREDIIYYGSTNASPTFAVQLAGTSYCDGTYHVQRRKSEIYVLEYILEGTGTIVHGDIKYTASQGDFYLLKRGVRQHYYASSQDPWVKVWMNIQGALVDHLLEVYPLDQIVYPNMDVLELFQRFHRALKESPTANELEHRCALILHEILSTVYHRTVIKTSVHEDATRIKTYLDQHFLETVRLSDLSQLIYKSVAQTIRIYKKAYDMTPYAYVLDKKIQFAKTLLVQTNISIREISERLNFADEHYFSNYFKQVEMISPSTYRQEHS